MKRNAILTLILVAVFTITATAQISGFGVKAGLNLANFGGDVKDNGMLIGFHGGVYYNALLSDKFAIHPELVYSLQGSNFTGGDEDVPSTVSYINIPILAKYYFTEGLSALAGPQVGILMGAAIDGESEYDFLGTKTKVKDSYNGLDLGLGIGLNFELEMGLNFGVRYNLGLLDITDDPEGTESDNVTNQVIQVAVGMTFGS